MLPPGYRKILPRIITITALCTAGIASAQGYSGLNEAWGPNYTASRAAILSSQFSLRTAAGKASPVRRWNEIAVNASGLDHTPVAAGENRIFGQQLGPCRASRAMAIVHIAMFDALNAIHGGYESYTGIPRARKTASKQAAVAQAAHDTLAAMFPSQAPTFDTLLAQDLNSIPNGLPKSDGIAFGKLAASAILALRANDGSAHAEPRLGIDFFPSDLPGKWRQDPISQGPLALGAHWGEVTPFVLESGAQFRIPPPPGLNSSEYVAAYNEVKRLGGDGITTPTERTADQTLTGVYWAYDGTPSLCAPPRLYNQIAAQIATQKRANEMELMRVLTLVNVAMADAGIVSWESKYFYSVCRPVTGIREGGTGTDTDGDGNPATEGDLTFTPLGAPASNLSGPNFTPPFPSYPSGHATFGGALFETLRNFYRTDKIRFTFVSDELNGVTRGPEGNVRPLLPRRFRTLSQAEEENGQSRIYLGIHWAFDKTAGISQGRQVSDYVFTHAFRPLRKR